MASLCEWREDLHRKYINFNFTNHNLNIHGQYKRLRLLNGVVIMQQPPLSRVQWQHLFRFKNSVWSISCFARVSYRDPKVPLRWKDPSIPHLSDIALFFFFPRNVALSPTSRNVSKFALRIQKQITSYLVLHHLDKLRAWGV